MVLKHILHLFTFLFVSTTLAQSTKTIQGKVTDGLGPLADAVITNLTSSKKYLTDQKGNYEAEAEIGDYLEYTFIGMKKVKIKVEDVTRV